MTMNGPRTGPGPDRLAQAARLMLDELEAHRVAEAELARRHGAARDRGAALVRAIDVVLRGLSPAGQAPLVNRLALIQGRDRPPVTALGSSPATSAVLAFLAAQEGETVEVAALTAYLKKIGLTQHRRYAACTLARMARCGLVARARRGLYRINRYHPELMAIRKVGRAGRPDAP